MTLPLALRLRSPLGLLPALALAALSLGTTARAQYPYEVVDLDPQGSSNATPIYALGDRLLFVADVPATGRELYSSDGTEAGTQLVIDANPGLADGIPQSIKLVRYEIDGRYPFMAITGGSVSLLTTDGTPAGTEVVLAPIQGGLSMAVALGKLFLLRRTPAGADVYASDGTAAGTTLLVSIAHPLIQYDLVPMGEVGGRFVFYVDDGVHGIEPWVSDGTPAGTQLLADIRPGPAGSRQFGLGGSEEVNGLLVFDADDGVHGRELWRSDGTTVGTQLVLDANPGAGDSVEGLLQVLDFNRYGDFVLLAMRTDASGTEPWRTDGTAAGTFMLADVHPGVGSSSPELFQEGAADAAAFAAFSPATGYEVWVSDGSLAGTAMIEFLPGPASGFQWFNEEQFLSDGTFFFRVGTPTLGNEIGVSDGTPAGTMVLGDLALGAGAFYDMARAGDFVLLDAEGPFYSNGDPSRTHPMPTDPSDTDLDFGEVVIVGDRLFMGAANQDGDYELWAVDLDVDGDGTLDYFDDLNLLALCECPGASAPCGNSDPAAGCANSTGQGALLSGSGSTRIADDDLVLSVSGMPPNQNGILFMGTASVAPLPFFDGLRCAGGPIARWPLQNSGPAGTFTYGPGLAALSAGLPPGFQFEAGQTRTLQAWYRDPATPCGGDSNLSSAVKIVLTP